MGYDMCVYNTKTTKTLPTTWYSGETTNSLI